LRIDGTGLQTALELRVAGVGQIIEQVFAENAAQDAVDVDPHLNSIDAVDLCQPRRQSIGNRLQLGRVRLGARRRAEQNHQVIELPELGDEDLEIIEGRPPLRQHAEDVDVEAQFEQGQSGKDAQQHGGKGNTAMMPRVKLGKPLVGGAGRSHFAISAAGGDGRV
jgi:hypothetical protein